MLRLHLGRVAALGAALGWVATAGLVAAEPSAAGDPLQARGLVRAGTFYVLRDESGLELKTKVGEVRALRKRWESARARLEAVLTADLMIEKIDDEIAATVHTRNEYQTVIDYLERNKWRGTRAGSFNSPHFSPGEWHRAAQRVIGGIAPTIYGTNPRQPDGDTV